MTFPTVSVVIPVKNEAFKIRACIDGILSQSVPVCEIIVIDSGSSDGTVEILKSYPQVILIEIPGSEFNHGTTRNLGVQKATGDYVLLTVGDARPYNQFWIEELLKGFVDDEVAGVCGQQVVPHEKDKNPVEWFRPVSEPKLVRYQFLSAKAFELLTPQEKKNICGWDDVTAMYRRSHLLKIPFQKTSYSEDAIWARDAILKGYAIVYNQKARVYHYHLEDEEFTFKRALTTSYFRYKQFKYIPGTVKQGVMVNLRMIKSIWSANPLGFFENWKWLKYNISQRRSLAKAVNVFSDALKKGEQELDMEHTKYCGKPPIPQKQAS